MKSVKLLDCTLRDGGYVNNWKFGKTHIIDTMSSLEESGIDILEVGFIRDEPRDEDRTVFRSIEDITKILGNKKPGIEYAAMAEVTKPVPMELIMPHNEETVDAIRVIIWKDRHDANGNVIDALQEGYEYCKGFAEKGYDLYVQPARVEQYSDEEFIRMLRLYSDLHPKAVYIVDSWGTMFPEDVLHYVKLADQNLASDVSIGFHGHNNLMQAFANAVEFVNYETDRELILDASVYGIGRGAGNLNTEIIAKYLNEKKGKNYNLQSFFEIYEDTVKEIREDNVWGYTPCYFMSAHHHANPQYGSYYGFNKKNKSTVINNALKAMPEEDKTLYSDEKAEKYILCLNDKQ